MSENSGTSSYTSPLHPADGLWVRFDLTVYFFGSSPVLDGRQK